MQPTTRSTFLLVVTAWWILISDLPVEAAESGEVNLQLERFEQIGGEDISDSSKFRVRKYNRTVFVLDGTLRILKDLDDSYEVTVKMAYSSLGNNQYNEYPMKVARKTICKILVEDYVDYQFIWGNSTNLPVIEKGTKEYCPFPAGDYWAKELDPDSSFIPKVVPAGLWRMTWEFWRPADVLVLQLRFFYRMTKGMSK